MNLPKKLQRSLHAEIDPAFALRARMIFEHVAGIRPGRVLDMGCGRGFYTHGLTFFPFVKRIDAVDINGDYLRVAKSYNDDARIRFHQAGIYKLPFPDSTFDCIICTEVLEHIGSEKKSLQELRRVLKKNGALLITVPNVDFPFLWDPLNWLLMKLFGTHIDKNIWWLAGIWADHDRLYSRKQFSNVLRQNGFRTGDAVPVIGWSWPFAHFLLYGIGKNIVERLPGGRTFSRFTFSTPSPVTSALSRFMEIPSRLLDRRLPLTSSVNLFALAEKI